VNLARGRNLDTMVLEKLTKVIRVLLGREPKSEMALSAVIRRADGTVEDLGVISVTKTPKWTTQKD
jgi:hypothetical protein